MFDETYTFKEYYIIRYTGAWARFKNVIMIYLKDVAMWKAISVYVDALLKALNVDIFRVPRRIKRAIKNHKKSYIKKPYENRPNYEYILPTERWRQIVQGDF